LKEPIADCADASVLVRMWSASMLVPRSEATRNHSMHMRSDFVASLLIPALHIRIWSATACCFARVADSVGQHQQVDALQD
jgi:hypothetical protein